MTIHCTGHETTKRAPLQALVSAPLSDHHRVVVAKLIKAYPNPVRAWELIDALYGHDPNGGPENGSHALASMVTHVRARLEEFGWTIPLAKRGPKSTGYRLAPMEIKK